MYNILPNVGFVSKKLDLTTIKKLNNYIKNKKHNVKKELAGNIHGSYYLEDKNNWFFKNELMPLVSEYIQNTLNFNVTPSILTKNCNYVSNRRIIRGFSFKIIINTLDNWDIIAVKF